MKMTPEQKEALGQGHLVNHSEQRHIPANKLRHGSLKDRIPVQIDSKTTIYVNQKHDADKQADKYRKHMMI